MGIGIVGKAGGTRMVTGSVHYGKQLNEGYNLEHREFPDKLRGRTILVMGQRIKQEIVYINPVVKAVHAVKSGLAGLAETVGEVVKRVRKPSRKSVVVEA